MYQYWAVVGAAILIIAWLGYLSYQFWKVTGLLERLFPSIDGSFKTTLAEVLKQGKDLEEFRKLNLKSISKVACSRYNPYHDTGGDQSFSLAMLNGMGDGVVLTSLHARAGTRVYTKAIKKGLAEGVKLAEEEEEVVRQAMKT